MIFSLTPSKILLYYRILVFLFAVLSLAMTQSLCVFCAGLGLMVLFALHEKDAERWISLAYKKDREWIIESATAGMMSAVLQPSPVMMRYLLILQFERLSTKEKKILLVFSDQLREEAYRALRRCIRYGSGSL